MKSHRCEECKSVLPEIKLDKVRDPYAKRDLYYCIDTRVCFGRYRLFLRRCTHPISQVVGGKGFGRQCLVCGKNLDHESYCILVEV